MGFLKGGVSFRRFRLIGDLPNDHPDTFQPAIQKHTFRSIDGPGEEEVSVGWVNIHDPLDTELTTPKFLFDDLVLLSLRIDRKRIPSKVYSAYVKKAEKDFQQAEQRPMLSRAEKQNIRDLVKTQLLRRVLPSLSTYDLVFDTTTGEVRFWSLSKNVLFEFTEIFDQTFGYSLLSFSPYGLANKVLPESRLDRLETLSPSHFVRPRRRS